FMNIISNSIDAIEDKGIITISTSKSNGFIQIIIKDSGSGMPENIKAKIFDPFYTTKEVGEGTGLGLSISHGIIEKHGGSIKVQSDAGKGTEFIIHLPLIQEKNN
ncbi:MAG: GHKL domain-containing protein, partial [Cyclobacteriaceae bacterium]|nr:GHKL domain-containing protein [Cyclobacteriaceae bacterium]